MQPLDARCDSTIAEASRQQDALSESAKGVSLMSRAADNDAGLNFARNMKTYSFASSIPSAADEFLRDAVGSACRSSVGYAKAWPA